MHVHEISRPFRAGGALCSLLVTGLLLTACESNNCDGQHVRKFDAAGQQG